MRSFPYASAGAYIIRIGLAFLNETMTDEIKTDIRVKLLPRSSKSQIMGMEGGYYRVKVNSPPVDGEANKELVSLISKKLSIPKGSIEIISGKTSRMKTLRLRGIDKESVSGLMLED